MAGEQMTIRRESAAPAGAPFVGVNQLLYNEADGGLYVKLPDGQVRRVNVPPSDARVNAGDDRGVNAVDLQYVRESADQVASGVQSFIAAGENNKTPGVRAFASGAGGDASGQDSTTQGNGNTASNQSSVAQGDTCISSGYAAVAQGWLAEATGLAAIAQGAQSKSRFRGSRAQAGGQFASRGDAQLSTAVLRKATTNATPAVLFSDGAAERLVLEDNRLYAFRIKVVAKNTGADENAIYILEGAIKRGTGAASTALVGVVVLTIHHEDVVAWAVVAQADATNGALEVQVTGEAGKTIRWVAYVEWVEVGV